MNDDDLLSLLAESFDEVEPTPAAALDVAVAAIGMRDLDDRLAELIFDSWRQEHAGATRATATDARLLSFTGDGITLDVELHADGTTVLGQITPQGTHVVQLETADGSLVDVGADEFGRFRHAVPAGPVRLRVAGRLVTPWVSR